MFNLFLFLHIAGLIIALGAVTVIDLLGFTSRNSKKLTQVTIHAHHITKLLIWIGTLLILISWPFLYEQTLISNIKSILLVIMILNGSFLSFYISPKLNKHLDKNTLLPKSLKLKITLSMLVSFFSWWTFVVLTVKSL